MKSCLKLLMEATFKIIGKYHTVNCTEASMDPWKFAIMFPWSRCFMLTCNGKTRPDDMKCVNIII